MPRQGKDSPVGVFDRFWLCHCLLPDFGQYKDIGLFRFINTDRLARFIPSDCQQPIIIDEVQRVPELLNEVHRLIEKKQQYKNKNIRFILIGSSTRKLRVRGVNLLAGRDLTRFMHPLTVQELGDDFSLDTSLKFGHLPTIYSEPDPADYLASYIQTYLHEEVAIVEQWGEKYVKLRESDALREHIESFMAAHPDLIRELDLGSEPLLELGGMYVR